MSFTAKSETEDDDGLVSRTRGEGQERTDDRVATSAHAHMDDEAASDPMNTQKYCEKRSEEGAVTSVQAHIDEGGTSQQMHAPEDKENRSKDTVANSVQAHMDKGNTLHQIHAQNNYGLTSGNWAMHPQIYNRMLSGNGPVASAFTHTDGRTSYVTYPPNHRTLGIYPEDNYGITRGNCGVISPITLLNGGVTSYLAYLHNYYSSMARTYFQRYFEFARGNWRDAGDKRNEGNVSHQRDIEDTLPFTRANIGSTSHQMYAQNDYQNASDEGAGTPSVSHTVSGNMSNQRRSNVGEGVPAVTRTDRWNMSHQMYAQTDRHRRSDHGEGPSSVTRTVSGNISNQRRSDDGEDTFPDPPTENGSSIFQRGCSRKRPPDPFEIESYTGSTGTEDSRKLRKIHPKTAVVSDNRRKYLYVIGGIYQNSKVLMERYDIKCNYWTRMQGTEDDLRIPRIGMAVTLYKGNIWLAGGKSVLPGKDNKVYMYNLDTGTWIEKPAMIEQRILHGLIEYRGSLYAVGGVFGSKASNTTEVYDDYSKGWRLSKTMLQKRHDFAITVWNNCIYVAGGTSFRARCKIECFDGRSWCLAGSFDTPRRGFRFCVINNTMYAVGGDAKNTILRYDQVEKKDQTVCYEWREITNFKVHGRIHMSVASVDGSLYLVGGGKWNNKAILKTVQRYDPSAKENSPLENLSAPGWFDLRDMITPRCSAGIAVVSE